MFDRFDQTPPLMFVQLPGERRALSQLSRPRRVSRNRANDSREWLCEHALPFPGPLRVNAALGSPSTESAPGSFDGLIVQPLANQPVIREGMKLGHAMTALPSAGQQPLEIDRFLSLAATLSDDGRQRATRFRNIKAPGHFEEFDELSERDFTAAARRKDGSDLASLQPPLQRILGHTEQPRYRCGSDGRTKSVLDELARSRDGRADLGVSALLGLMKLYLSEPQHMYESLR